MIINKEYILNRMIFLAQENVQKTNILKRQELKLYNIKKDSPKWIQSFAFRYYNPIYSMWKQKKQELHNRKHMKYSEINDFCVYFFDYCFNNDIHFDTNEYFENQDQEIAYFIDRKIKTFLSGFDYEDFTDIQLASNLEEQQLRKSIVKENGCYKLDYQGKIYYLPKNEFASNVFIARYGMDALPQKVLQSIKGKIFIDVGAYFGDMSLILAEYAPSEIYAFEPVERNFLLLEKTISMNKIPFINAVKIGLGDEKKNQAIELKNYSSTLLTASNATGDTEEILLSTIDDEFENKNVGLIKLDVEGFEYFVLKGGLNTIAKNKPVLLISIYHTGKDFFEIPPMLREIVPSYKFIFFDAAPNQNISEKLIIAYAN